MKYVKLTFLFTAMLLFASSCFIDECLTKDSFLEAHKTFTDEVSDNYETYKSEDWEKKDEQFEKFVESCYEKHGESLTKEERKDFWINSLKYYYQRHGMDILTKLNEESNEVAKIMNENLEKVVEDSGEDVERILKEVVGEELPKLIDDVIEELGDFSDALKEWFESESK